jgi:hypothetical protein
MPTYQDDPVVSRNHNGDPEFDGGVYGESSLFNGVRGVTYAPGHGAVVGVQENSTDQAGPGVFGQSRAAGVWGHSQAWHGVYGHSESGGHGVSGEGPVGVAGVGLTWIGVYGETRGTANGPSGVLGEGGAAGVGVKGHAKGDGVPGVAGYSLTNRGPGIFGQGSPAGQFVGDVIVNGHLTVHENCEFHGDCALTGADCAEEFDLASGPVEPGTVVVLSDQARLLPSASEYDTRVAGVVSGAGDYRPALTLDARESDCARVPVALMGKVCCLADACEAPIEVGDMLTTSATPGHAMKVSDPERAFGAVIGKALAPLDGGRSLIPVLATLR